MNASWTGSAIQLNPNVNISIAIAVKDGVVGAVIPNADTRDASQPSAPSGGIWPSAPAPAACIRPTSPAARSPSAISACSAWMLSARSSRRRKPPCWLSAALPIAWCR